MKKNIKNKVLAFSMASAMVVPNVAVVFAEAPKAGLATVAKNATASNYNWVTVHIAGKEETETVIIPEKKLGATSSEEWKTINNYDYSSILEKYGWELDSSVYDGFAPSITLTKEWGNVGELYVVEKKAEEPEQEYDNDIDLVFYEGTNEISRTRITTVTGKLNESKKIPATKVSEALAKMPEGYELDGPFSVDGHSTTIQALTTQTIGCWIKKTEAPADVETYRNNVYVDFKDENENVISSELYGSYVGADEELAATIKATDLSTWLEEKKPAGYKLSVPEEVHGYTVTIDKDATDLHYTFHVAKNERTLYVNYLDETTGEEVGSEELVVPADDTYFNTSKLANVPAGYEVCEVGDIPFSAATVSIKVRKAEKTTTLHVLFETVDGLEVGETTVEKTTDNDGDVVFTLDDITLPAGYHWVDYNDQVKEIKLPAGSAGAHVMFVEQDETQTVLNVTFETPDGTVVGTTSAAKDFTVDEEGVKVATFVVGEDFTLPEGYHFAEDVDQIKEIIVNGTVGGHTVIVEKDEAPAPAPSEDPKKDDTKKDTPATATPAPTATAEAKKEETKQASKTANTADSSNVAAYALPLAMSMIAIGAIVVGKKKLS